MLRRRSLARRGLWRLQTLIELVRQLATRQRFFLIPLVLVLLLAGVLLLFSQGFSYVAPFVYTIF